MCCWNVEITKGNEEIFGANKSRKQLERQDKIQEFSYIVNKSIGNRDNTVQFLCVNEEERKRNNNKHRANTIIVIKTRFVNHLDRIYNKNNK